MAASSGPRTSARSRASGRGVPRFALLGCLGLTVLYGRPAPLSAQSAIIRADLTRYQVNLDQQNDTVTLRRLDRQLDGRGGSAETEALRRLRRGLVRRRLSSLGDAWSYGRAADDFAAAARLQPSWPVAAYQEGMARQAEAAWKAQDGRNLGKRVGMGALGDAVGAFARALAADSSFTPAAVALYQSGRGLRDTAEFTRTVLPALRRVVQAGQVDTAVLLALAHSELLYGDSTAALEPARRYLALGGSQGIGLRELAWAGFLTGDPTADSAYYSGAAAEDSASIAEYRADLALIADGAELAAFDLAGGAFRAEWLRQFWLDRDRQALRQDGERIREHYRRMAHADRHFALEVNRRHYSEGDLLRSHAMRFDDRGVVYVRYGTPDDYAATSTFGIQRNETWVIRRADGDLLLHFSANAGGDVRDLRLIPSLFQIGGVDTGQPGGAAITFALLDRCDLYRPYCKFPSWGRYGQQKIAREERILVRASAAVAVSSDGFERHFPKELEAEAAAFAVGRSQDRTLVHLAFQIAVAVPDSVPEEARLRAPVGIRLNLSDAAGRSVGWIDTTAVLELPAGTAGVVQAMGRIAVPVPVGQWHYRVALAYGDSTGRVFALDSVRAARFDGSELAVSDLVLARVGRGARWVPTPADTAYFTPYSTWSQSDTLSLYSEIYGLTPGAAYQARLVLRRGKRAVLTLGWEGTAEAVTRNTRTLSFATVRPGSYVLELEVTEPGGRRAASSRPINITGAR